MTDTNHTKLVDRLNIDNELLLIGLVAGVTLLIDTVGRWALAVVLHAGVGPLALLVILVTTAVDKRVRWGVVVGLLSSGLLLGDWTGGVINASAAFVAIVVCERLRVQHFADEGVTRWFRRYATVVAIVGLTVVAVSAWLSDLTGIATFSVVVAQSLTGNILLALLGAPAAWVVADVSSTRGWNSSSVGISAKQKTLVLVVLVTWVGGGYLGSFLYRAMNTIPSAIVGRRIGELAEQAVVLGGPQGRYAVTALSVISVAVLVAVLRFDSATRD